ncbi:NUDIX hydrolase [Calidifontibacillus oryziterrae]|uniref:NUDIX hydrolase n=1 Tax=Calidifontibacillus oryziterrae TaxID=1191699 RepID=UPI0002DBCFEC|nr:NUDIX hydrolase [Calidifontibacillus oryziterrae]
MFYRQEVQRILPERLDEVNRFFDKYLFPTQLKNGAKLVGRWVSAANDEIMTLWEYPSYEDYLKIEERVKKDEIYLNSKKQHSEVEKHILDSKHDFLSATGSYQQPRHTVTVSGLITNESNETLLVKTFWRDDTWELPGGGVDEGETLDVALSREILEETGIEVKLLGITGVYSNGATVAIVFRGKYRGGAIRTSEETKDVQFVKLDPVNVRNYIKREKFVARVVDALQGNCIPYESFSVRPYRLLQRLEGTFNM